MLDDLAAGDPVPVSADCPLGQAADDVQYLELFVQQCRHDAGTLTYRLPSCRIRSAVSSVKGTNTVKSFSGPTAEM